MREFITAIGLIVLTIILAMTVLFYEIHIVMKIASYYDIGMITLLGYKAMFGLIFIKGLIFYKSTDKLDGMDYAEKAEYVLTEFIEGLFNISLFWFIAWVMSFIIT